MSALAFSGTAVATITQTTPLVAGWNWFSPNVDITLDDLKAALFNAIPNSTIQINSKEQYTNFIGNRWRGTMYSIDVAQMYLIKVGADCEISLEGMPINPAEHSITIAPGDNWIGFPYSEDMSVSDAFMGFAQMGDVIISQTVSAVYDGSQWRGSLTDLKPGQGYIYRSAETSERTFTFPDGNFTSAQAQESESHWADFDYHQYKLNEPVFAFVQIDGDDISASYNNWQYLEVAAFAGDECRGHAFLVDNTETFSDPLPVLELPIYYDGNATVEPVTFRLYDHQKNIEYIYDPASGSAPILTGETHVDLYVDLAGKNFNDDRDDFLFLNFTPAEPKVTVSAVTNNSAYLNWPEMSGVEYWEIRNGDLKYNLTGSNSFKLKNLAPDTEYTAQVKAHFENSEVENLGKATFTTLGTIPGDVNNDNKVTPADAIMILYYYFNVTQNGFYVKYADLNNDTAITPADAIEALYLYFGASNTRTTRPTTEGDAADGVRTPE